MNTRSVKAIHTFPNVSRIKTDPDVVKKMNEAWEEMQNYAAKGKRREYGFYIYYDAVSYTHLDVYKRQIMMNPQIKFIVERCKWETIYPTAKALMHL